MRPAWPKGHYAGLKICLVKKFGIMINYSCPKIWPPASTFEFFEFYITLDDPLFNIEFELMARASAASIKTLW